MNGEEPPFKRRRMDFLMLPDDLVLNCLARVSRLYYPVLSLVSKKFRSLLASTELYQTRTLLDRTESCLYVCLRQSTYSGSKKLGWFTLYRRPNSSKKILVPISYPDLITDFADALWTDVAVVVGPNIYTIGGYTNNNVSSRVRFMNCRTHTWREAPRMQVPRRFQSTCVLDGKIYVTGGRRKLDAAKWMEVFDTKTQTWEFMHTPNEEICRSFQYESVGGYEGTVYVRDLYNDVTYKLHKGRWIKADIEMNTGWGSSSSVCVIENVFYCCNRSYGGTIEWYDSEKRLWTTLKGLEKLPILGGSSVKLADYGGKMMVLWKEYKYVIKKHSWEITIWCAEIGIEKRQNGEIWGMLEWFDAVYTNNVNELHLRHAVVTTI